MWIAKNNYWHKDTTALEKFAVERIIQRCDYTESISNKHRTSNGFTQLKEIIQYCELTVKRSKTVKTLMIILEEAKSKYIKQNITSDFIINTYFIDLEKFISTFDQNKLIAEKGQPNLVVLQNLTHNLKLFEKQLDNQYFNTLKNELKKINYDEGKEVLRNAELISTLIDLLIPNLVFEGYSLATIGEILRHWCKCNYHITISKFLSFFHFKTRPFSFLQYLGEDNPESRDFFRLLQQQLEVEIKEINASSLDEGFLKENNIGANDLFASYSYNTLDPHKHVRSNFDRLLKKLVIKKERQSLAVFNSFFSNSFWCNKPKFPFGKYKRIMLDGDPINVNERGRTLRNTLIKSSITYSFDFTIESSIPDVELEQLQNAIYYYNLALGSKSIENSLSLLWTSLEAIQPYKVYNSDIEAIQAFISKGLSIGAVSRDIYGFAVRFMQSNYLNENSLNDLNTMSFMPIASPEGLNDWYNWMNDKTKCQSNFQTMKNCSELLAFQYLNIAKPMIEESNEVIFSRIKRSEMSIKYQLQRIYLHRNKIVHSGDIINEYTNLWMHLEWYVGKILAFFIISVHYQKKHDNLYSAFLELDSDNNYLCSYLEKNSQSSVLDLPERVKDLLFKYSWQAY